MNAHELVGERYYDALGVERVVPAATRDAFIAELQAKSAVGFAPPTRVLRDGEPLTVEVTLPAEAWSESLLWTLRNERGSIHAGTLRLGDAPVIRFSVAGGSTLDTRRITIPAAVGVGDHRLTLDVGTFGHAGIDVLVAPPAAYLPGERRVWGLAVQLYTLRSERNWGIGDFGDLERVCMLAADAGATLVGINPLHAAHRSDPEAASPYAPASRRFLNWLAVDVRAVAESDDPAVQAFVRSIAAELAALRRKPLVDYSGVAALKAPALRLCFAALRGARALAFEAFVREGGPLLRRFATYEMLVSRLGRDLRAWPAAYRQAGSAEVAALAHTEAEAVRFGMYLQWCATEQLAAVAARAGRHGVALYRDLAVGVESNSADVWAEPDAFTDASIGAPPDLLNLRGQDWGLPPLSPTALATDGYRGFAGLLADNMRHAGALRIDHAMSMLRLFWIPAGGTPTEGAYIRYPFDDLLGIVARESTRAKCLVIGEDLGTVPEGFRERMEANHIFSYRVLLFEREPDGAFLPPQAYPALALATAGTHDLPPLAGWLRAEDVAILERLAFIEPAVAGRLRAARQVDVSQLVHALQASGDLDEATGDAALVLAAYRYLARTPARIVMVQLEDIIGETSPVNVPGTSSEFANWRRKLQPDLEAIGRSAAFARFAETMRELRPRA